MSVGRHIAGARGNAACSQLPWSAYALHQSPDGGWELHIGSCAALLLAELDAELNLGEFTLWSLGSQQTPLDAAPLRRRDLILLDEPLEVFHAPTPMIANATVEASSSFALLRDLPESRFAMSLADGDHGVLYTYDPEVAAHAVRLLLCGIFSDLAGSDALPSLQQATAEALLHTVPAGRWEQVDLTALEHGWMATFQGDGVPTRHWIGAATGTWRTDWTWYVTERD